MVTALERGECIQLKNSIQLVNGSLLKSKLKQLAIQNYFNRMECYAPHDILRPLDYMHMCVCFFFLFIRWPEIFVSLARSGNDLRLFIHIICIYTIYIFFPHFTKLQNMWNAREKKSEHFPVNIYCLWVVVRHLKSVVKWKMQRISHFNFNAFESFRQCATYGCTAQQMVHFNWARGLQLGG